jgi:uncharacterized protein
MTSPSALDDAAIERLSDLLDLRAVPFQGFNLEALDGFLSALAVSPELIMPSVWQPVVWGPKPPRWENVAEVLEVQTLLMGHWNTCAARVRYGDEELPEALSPLLWLPENPEAEHPDDLDVGHDWAHGFFRAVELCGDGWQHWLEQHDWVDEIFALLEQLATGEAPVEPGDPPEKLSYRERLEIVASLPGMLNDLHLQRIEDQTPRTPVRRAATPERNALCPCGSGKKYKRCHGAN